MNNYLVAIKCIKLLLLQLLSASIIESINSNEVIIQKQENVKISDEISSLKNITTIGRISSQFTDCSQLVDCLRCNVNGCIKCTHFIMKDTRRCTKKCPTKYINQWSSSSDLMGQICVQSSAYNSLQTVFVGIMCGVFLCFFVVFIGVIILKKRQQKIHRKSIKDQLISDEYDQHEFIRQLDDLRPYANCFLFILNDTRKEIRSSYFSGETTAAAKFYPIIRDLAKILILLNRPVELIDGPPHDWNRLLQWAERILAQYKPQPKVKEFVEFLQSSTSSPIFNNDDTRLVSEYTTFKSLFYSTPLVQNRKKINNAAIILSDINSNPSNLSKYSNIRNNDLHIPDEISSKSNSDTYSKGELNEVNNMFDDKTSFGSLISLQEFTINSNLETLDKKYNLNNSSVEHINSCQSKGSLQVVEDDLIELKLGLRPQDEIITEL